jgi:membrane protein
LAAAVAYYAALSLLPLLLILISVLGFVLRFSSGAQDAQAELLGLLARNTSPGLAEQAGAVLAEVRAKAGIGGPLGFLGLVLAAVAIFAQFERAFDRIWNVPTPRRGILAALRSALWQRLRAFLMLAGLGALVIAVFAAGMAGSAVRPVAEHFPGGRTAWSLVHIPLSILLNLALFTLIYKAVPKVKVRWPEALQGGLVAAVLWEVARQVLALGLFGSRYSAYGVIGSLIILMLWIYAAGSVLFLGAEYVRVACPQGNPDEADAG